MIRSDQQLSVRAGLFWYKINTKLTRRPTEGEEARVTLSESVFCFLRRFLLYSNIMYQNTSGTLETFKTKKLQESFTNDSKAKLRNRDSIT